MEEDYQKQEQLEAARRADQRRRGREIIKKNNTGKHKGNASKTIKEAEELIKSTTPWGILGLIRQVRLSDWMYILALMAAILKDILDPLSLTGVLYVVLIIITFCVSIFIGLMMLLGSISSGYGRFQQKIIKSYLILFGATVVELLPGVSLIPIETVSVLIIWGMLLASRKQNERMREYQKQLPAIEEE
ncbi:MAG TPA: hypothetical protein PLK35_01270 [Candidatus Moranbacteria bacterium]|nr:hypothetical protein [Candidatus Moranbacteria bacterium]